MNIFQQAILHALNVRERAHRGHMYEGTVPEGQAEGEGQGRTDGAASAAEEREVNYRLQAWVNVVITLIELGVAYWCSETSDPFGVVLSIVFAVLFAIVAALYFWLGRKRQPRIVIKATTLADAQRIIENLTRKDVR